MKKMKILIPVYNDWESVFKLLENIDQQIFNCDMHVSVLIINDASTDPKPRNNFYFKNLKEIQIINMIKNKGHARCNAAGLKYIDEKENVDYVIPMDGDGEDRPEELNEFIKKLKDFPEKVITANRVKRSEGFFFKFCYFVHKLLTFVFTGKSIEFGNYTCLPKLTVHKMANESATWSSFSGSLTKVTDNRISFPSIRGPRYFGPSKMSFFNLLKHSFSIIAVFKTALLIRSLVFLIFYTFFIFNFISVITLIPILLTIIMIISIFIVSKRQSYTQLKNSLDNIKNIEAIK
jgi:polyisoprenyl-phosphate glycosyltransferase